MVQIDPFGSFAQGVSLRNNMNQQRANVQAAQGLASGNYAQALGALGSVGDVGGVVQVQNAQAQNQERQLEQQKQQQAQQLQSTLQIIGTVKRARDQGQDVSQILPAYRDAFIAMGTDPQQLAQIEQQVAANPAFLDQIENIVGQQARELSFQKAGDNLLVFEAGNPDPVRSFNAPRQPVNVNGVLIDPSTREVILDARDPKYQTITNTDGSTSLIAIDQPAPIRGSGGGNGSFESVIGPLLQREGGYVARDGSSGAPANYGINQRANPDVNVRDLTPQAATQLYRERYWNPVVEAGVPPQAREAVFDFAVNAGPQRAIAAWRQSGGDINAFNQARLEHYRRQPDYAQFGRSWERRVAETTPGTVDTRGGMRVVAQGENRGLTPAQQLAETRAQATENRDIRNTARQLRTEFEAKPDIKNFREVEASYRQVRQLAASGSATDDVGLIFSFMKMLDPGSVVREGEYALVGRAQGLTGRALLALQRIDSGQSLTPDLRREVAQTANQVYQSRLQRYNELENQYRTYAQEDGIDPNRVVSPRETQASNQPRTNAPGLPFNISEQQLATRQRIVGSGGRPSARLGTPQNPRYINPAAATTSYNNIPRGEYYVAPDGQLRRKG